MQRLTCKISYRFFLIAFIAFIFAVMSSCNSARRVPEDKYLLTKVEFEKDNKEVEESDLQTTLRQKPNRKTLFLFKFHLGVYNFFYTEKEKGFRSWVIRVIGEAPAVYDEYETEKSVSNIKSYLQSQSYYDAKVQYKTRLKKWNKKKIILTYMIESGEPYVISDLHYDILDPKVRELVYLDTVNSLVKKNYKLNTEDLQSERERITRLLKTNGYYYFSLNNIHYYADSTKNPHEVELTLAIRKSYQEQDLIINEEIFTPQTIRNVYIYPDYNSQSYLSDPEAYNNSLDTLVVDGYKIIYNDKLEFKPSTLLQSCFINVGDWYNIRNVEETHSHLSTIKQFRLINIKLNASEDVFLESQKEKFMDAHIYLTPVKKRDFNAEVEGNNTSGNIGMAAVLSLSDRNLFKGAQILSVKGSLSFQTITSSLETEKISFFNTLEYGGELRLNIPRLMIPFFDNYDFVKNHNPHTQLGVSFNYQKRPEYTRTIANASYGYIWKGGKNNYITHYVNPIELYLVKIFDFDPEFQNEIQNSFLKFSYEDQLLTVISYDLIYNNQNVNKLRDFSTLLFNIETSGNIPSLIYKWAGKEKVEDSYRFMGVEFSQFVKTDLDYRFFQIFNANHRLVYRAFMGIGIPYGNSTKGLPFIKKYFIGGANDLRAWQIRALGPGSYTNSTSNIDQNGDMKLVFNMEYRFKMVSFLNGAIFIDAGNIWSINKQDTREGALFQFNKFYKEIALGTGLGLRLDFSLLVIRLDFGVPLYDPMFNEGERWLNAFKPFKLRNFTLNFGIGYPF